MKRITLTPKERKQLQERFQIGENYALDVLAYRKNGPTAREIRRAALQMGGRFVDPDFAPNCRTQYVGGDVIQTFADNVILRIEIHSGNLTISHKGIVQESIQNATMSIWNSMAQKAQEMAEAAMVAR